MSFRGHSKTARTPWKSLDRGRRSRDRTNAEVAFACANPTVTMLDGTLDPPYRGVPKRRFDATLLERSVQGRLFWWAGV